MFNLKDSVKERVAERMDAVSDADIERHSKVVDFRDSIRKSLQQGNAGDMMMLCHSVPFIFALGGGLGFSQFSHIIQ